MVEREVPVLQLLEVTQHLMLGVVRIEHRMRQDGVGAQQRGRNRAARGGDSSIERRKIGLDTEATQYGGNVVCRGGLIHRETDAVIGGVAEVVAGCLGCGEDLGPSCADFHLDGVKKRRAGQLETCAAQRLGDDGSQPVHTCGDGAQTLRSMVDGVEPGHVGEQNLRGADVGVRLLATDVLFACLQRHAQRRLAAGILRYADDATGHGADVSFARGEEGGVRAAEPHRNAKALRRAERDVRPHRTWALEQHECQQIGRDCGHCTLRLESSDDGAQVGDLAVQVRVLQQGAEYIVVFGLDSVAEDQVEAEVVCTRSDDVDGLRIAGRIDKECVGFRFRHPARHGHRFGGGRRLVEQRGIGQLQPCQVDDHLLVIQ